MKPTTAYLTARAQEDLVAMVDEIIDHPELEHGGIIIGHYESDRGRVIVEQIRSNIFVKPYSPWETTTDVQAMAVYDGPGQRVCGALHTHPVSGPIEASEADFECWRRTASDLGEVHLGLILAPISTWWEGMPRDSWEEPPAPQIAAWAATPKGAVHRLAVAREPEWLARLRSQVISREERHRA
jgi:proteasome lid subunit RPN8/RPN11